MTLNELIPSNQSFAKQHKRTWERFSNFHSGCHHMVQHGGPNPYLVGVTVSELDAATESFFITFVGRTVRVRHIYLPDAATVGRALVRYSLIDSIQGSEPPTILQEFTFKSNGETSLGTTTDPISIDEENGPLFILSTIINVAAMKAPHAG